MTKNTQGAIRAARAIGGNPTVTHPGKSLAEIIDDETALPEMLKALKDVKAWFIHLEEGADEDDPLRALRKRFHAGVHRILDEAIQKAEGGQ